jgi:hypothetical protein
MASGQQGLPQAEFGERQGQILVGRGLPARLTGLSFESVYRATRRFTGLRHPQQLSHGGLHFDLIARVKRIFERPASP